MAAEIFRRRDLPHWDVPSAAYFVTSCLAGSISARGWLDVERYRVALSRRTPPGSQTEAEWAVTRWKLTFARMDQWLDQGQGTRHLQDERLAKIVMDALYHFAGQRYDLLGFVVMPSHLHWVFQPLESWIETLPTRPRQRPPRERIVHGLNRFTGLECNRLMGKKGAFWQHESYDHWVRHPEELERILQYIEENPMKAGLVRSREEWPYSSARERRCRGLELGEPLRR